MTIHVPRRSETETHHGPDVPPPDGHVPDTTGPDLLAGLRTGAWLDAQDFPPLRWVVPGVVPEGMTLLIGGPKIGKSWMSLGIGLAAASGGHALGALPVGPPRPVLLLALEDSHRRLQERARELLEGDPIPGLLHYMTTTQPGLLVPTVETWLHQQPGEPLVILDTLGKVMPPATPGESAYQRDYRVAGRLKRVCDDRPGAGLLVLHHDRKAVTDDFVDGVSGTNGIAGAADTITVLTRSRSETTGVLKVTGRDVTEGEYAVTITGGRWRLDGADLGEAARNAGVARVSAGLGDRTIDVLRFAAECPAGVTAADVAEALDIGTATATTYLSRQVKAGRLNRAGRGLYTPVMSVISVSSAPNEAHGPHTYNRHNRGSGEDTAAVNGKPIRCPQGFAEIQHHHLPGGCTCTHFANTEENHT